MAGRFPPEGAIPPKCKCGCGKDVSWNWGHGWMKWLKGHARRGKPGGMLGKKMTAQQRARMSRAAIKRYRGKRARDKNPIGPGVYNTREYRAARAKYVPPGSACRECGVTVDIHAHHLIPGDDSTLVPLCRKCHGLTHHHKHDSIGVHPPEGETPPFCDCGCGEYVRWHRGVGWAHSLKGHKVRRTG